MANHPYNLQADGKNPPAVGAFLIDPATGETVRPAGNYIVATNGDVFNGDGPTVYDRAGDGTINHVEITDGGSTYRQTWTWTDGYLTATSGWVLQEA